MPRLALSEADCKRILEAPKVIHADVAWIQKANKTWVTSKMRVEMQEAIRASLELVITVNVEEPSKFSFALLLNNAHRISGLDVNGSHINKCTDGAKYTRQTHKHAWSDACPGGYAYTPKDITGGSVNEVFEQFCKESNIVFEGKFRGLPLQPGLRGLS